MRSGVAATRITVETQVGGDVLTEQSIQFDNIAENVISDANNTRNIGSAANMWSEGHFVTAIINVISSSPRPNANGTREFGSEAFRWKTIFVNDIQGDARALIMMGI